MTYRRLRAGRTPVTAQAPTVLMDSLSAGDGYPGFSVAAELMAGDIWSQYANQVTSYVSRRPSVAVMMQLAGAATQREISLSTAETQSGNGALTFSVRPLQGHAAVIGGETATPRVQFQGGFGYYTFELTVRDARGNQSRDIVTVFYTGQ